MVCPKCGGENAKVYVNHRGAKVGKCHTCGFWGNFGKASEEEAEAAKQARAQKKAPRPEVEAAPPANRPASAGGKPVAEPKTYETPTGPVPWYDRDIFDSLF